MNENRIEEDFEDLFSEIVGEEPETDAPPVLAVDAPVLGEIKPMPEPTVPPEIIQALGLTRVRITLDGVDEKTGAVVRHQFASEHVAIRPKGTKGQRLAIKNPVEI